MSDLEARNRELERSNAALEQFAAMAAHDLSAPLRNIQAFLRLVERRHTDELSADARELVAHAVQASTRMQRLLDDLLIYSRVGTIDRPRERVSTNVVVGEVAQALAAGDRVEWSDLPDVDGHRSELVHLFQNLIGNALKFVPADREPRVTVTAERDGECWRFAIQDNGIGLDPARAGQLFEPFRRGVAGEDFDGSGIGLAIVRKVVEQHDGHVWVDRAEGDGARFCFTLPA